MLVGHTGPARPPSPEAYEVADTWKLGTPLAEYQAAPGGFCILLLAFIAVFIALLVCAFVALSVFGFVLAGLAAITSLSIWGVLQARYRESRRVLRAVLGTEGLLRLKDTQREVLHWDEIDSVWRQVKEGSEGSSLLVGYLVQRKDASEFKLGRDVIGMRDLGAAIEGAAIRRFLPDAIARYRRGEMVSFGPLGVNLGGAWVDGKLLAWGEITSVQANDITLVMKKQGKWLSWATRSVKKVPNVAVFAALVEQIRSDQI